VLTAVVIPICFVIIYGLSYLLKLGKPDWSMSFLNTLYQSQGLEAPDIPNTQMAWLALYGVTFLFAPIINSVFGFGEELGWRGYLLPKLMPLGKWKAYVLLAIIWAAWHFPMIWVGFMYPGYPLWGMMMFALLTFSLGIYMNELTLRYQSSVLPGFIHGVFNSQRLGVWTLLFPYMNPLMGGFSGLLGIMVWIILGSFTLKFFKGKLE
jgi:membrane protease YdiL (CAAX protease family)